MQLVFAINFHPLSRSMTTCKVEISPNPTADPLMFINLVAYEWVFLQRFRENPFSSHSSEGRDHETHHHVPISVTRKEKASSEKKNSSCANQTLRPHPTPSHQHPNSHQPTKQSSKHQMKVAYFTLCSLTVSQPAVDFRAFLRAWRLGLGLGKGKSVAAKCQRKCRSRKKSD